MRHLMLESILFAIANVSAPLFSENSNVKSCTAFVRGLKELQTGTPIF
jgi:hypothetical protein